MLHFRPSYTACGLYVRKLVGIKEFVLCPLLYLLPNQLPTDCPVPIAGLWLSSVVALRFGCLIAVRQFSNQSCRFHCTEFQLDFYSVFKVPSRFVLSSLCCLSCATLDYAPNIHPQSLFVKSVAKNFFEGKKHVVTPFVRFSRQGAKKILEKFLLEQRNKPVV